MIQQAANNRQVEIQRLASLEQQGLDKQFLQRFAGQEHLTDQLPLQHLLPLTKLVAQTF